MASSTYFNVHWLAATHKRKLNNVKTVHVAKSGSRGYDREMDNPHKGWFSSFVLTKDNYSVTALSYL